MDSNKIIDCGVLSNNLYLYINTQIKSINLKPHFVTILVGDNPASLIYVKNKQSAALSVGITNTVHPAKASISKEELIDLIESFNRNPIINGILLQLPLPPHLNASEIISSINPSKDIDGLHYANIGKLIVERNNGNPLQQNNYSGFVPATAMGCMFILNSLDINLKGLNCSIIGRSHLVGLPLFHMLNNNDATVTLLHKKTNNLKLYTTNSDVVIVAAGSANLLTKNLVKPNSVIIDVGINLVNGKIVGDCDTADLLPVVKYITPVPKGVGKLTVACMLINVIKACTK